MIKRNSFGPPTATSIQTTLTAKAHLAGQSLPEKQTLNKE
jgi:hypothetical protein